jgi:hypothetical protein
MLSYDEGRRPLVERELEAGQADILVDASSCRTRADNRPPLNGLSKNGKLPDSVRIGTNLPHSFMHRPLYDNKRFRDWLRSLVIKPTAPTYRRLPVTRA